MRAAIVGLALLVVLAFLGVVGYALARQTGFASGSVAASNAGAARVFGTGQLIELKPFPAPAFALQLFGGAQWQLSAQRGHPVLINFWASWCPPCKAEMPIVQAGYERWHDRLSFVGIDVWDTPQDAQAFLQQYGASYPNGDDPAGKIAINYGLTGVPETFIVDAKGQVIQHYIGPLDATALDALAAAAVAQP